MIDKYSLNFSQEIISRNIIRLTNQIWKLIPMREHEEDWKKQLNTVIIEIAGLGEIFSQEPQFLQILSKMEGLQKVDCDFNLFRKTVFEIINLIQRYNYA